MDKKWLIGILIISILILNTGNFKLGQKLAGETSSRSFVRTTIYNNQQITVSIAVTPGTSTYLAIDEKYPSGWTVVSASDSGDYTTTAGHIFWVVLSGATAKTYTYVINPNNNLGAQSFQGTIGFESKPEAPIGGTTSITVNSCVSSTEVCDNNDNDCDYSVDEGLSQSCGTGNCVGTQTCSTGSWGSCNTNNNDCGICCKCSSSGVETYDSTQNGDCTSTMCPSDGCNKGSCGTHIFSDYPMNLANTCNGLKQCTSNSCSPTCTTDTDNDGWAGADSSYSNCYDCNNNDAIINPSKEEICGDNIDNDCSGAVESYFNLADWGTPNGFCISSTCCDSKISMDELLVAIGKWKLVQFPMNDLLSTMGKWKISQ